MDAAAPAYAEVIVAAGDVRGDQTFHYRVPERLLGRLHPGQLVMAPFGSRQLPGVVTALAVTSPVEETRELLQLVWEPRLIGPRQLALARWVAARYGAPLRSVLDLVAPPRLAHHLHAAYTAADTDGPAEDLPRADRRVLELVRERGGLSEAELRGQLGKTAATRGVARLVRQGLVNRHLSLRFPEPPAERLAVAVAPTNGELPAELLRRAPKQRALWEHLRRAGGPLPWPRRCARFQLRGRRCRVWWTVAWRASRIAGRRRTSFPRRTTDLLTRARPIQRPGQSCRGH